MENKLRLYNKNFTMVIIGQIISIFGNSLLRFSIPLYILSITKSSATFGMTLGLSVLPIIIFSPISGIIADCLNKRNTMILLDSITACIIGGLLISFIYIRSVALMGIVLLLLSSIQAIYQPTVHASVPLLVEKYDLVTANAVVNQVNSLSKILGPIIGGMIYDIGGIFPILIFGFITFTISAILEMSITIPHIKKKEEVSVFVLMRRESKECLSFLKKKPMICKIAILVASFNLLFDSMITIGIPQVITKVLSLSSQYYGIAQASLSFGALIGGVIVAIYGKRIPFHKTYYLFGSTIFSVLPIIFALKINKPYMSFIIICISCFIFMMICTIYSVLMTTYIQKQTPPELIGKVIAYVLALTSISLPIGNTIYGLMFDIFIRQESIIIVGTILINILVTLYARRILLQAENK
ncbi:MAG: MFS transporter [Coprobacillaceae bacterium]